MLQYSGLLTVVAMMLLLSQILPFPVKKAALHKSRWEKTLLHPLSSSGGRPRQLAAGSSQTSHRSTLRFLSSVLPSSYPVSPLIAGKLWKNPPYWFSLFIHSLFTPPLASALSILLGTFSQPTPAPLDSARGLHSLLPLGVLLPLCPSFVTSPPVPCSSPLFSF